MLQDRVKTAQNGQKHREGRRRTWRRTRHSSCSRVTSVEAPSDRPRSLRRPPPSLAPTQRDATYVSIYLVLLLVQNADLGHRRQYDHDATTYYLSIFILIGLLGSYLPQHYRIIASRSSEGFSPWFLLLGATSSASSFFNVVTLQWGVVRCCKYLVRSRFP